MIWVIQYSFKNLRAQLHRDQVATIEFAINRTNSFIARLSCVKGSRANDGQQLNELISDPRGYAK